MKFSNSILVFLLVLFIIFAVCNNNISNLPTNSNRNLAFSNSIQNVRYVNLRKVGTYLPARMLQ